MKASFLKSRACSGAAPVSSADSGLFYDGRIRVRLRIFLGHVASGFSASSFPGARALRFRQRSRLLSWLF